MDTQSAKKAEFLKVTLLVEQYGGLQVKSSKTSI